MKPTAAALSRPLFAACLLSLAAATAHAQMTALGPTCAADKTPTTPDEEFEDAGPGFVLHKRTGLMWKRCSEGQTWDAEEKACDGEAKKFRWDEAAEHIQQLNAKADPAESLGHGDWRMPELTELQSIIEYTCRAPSINQRQFPKSPSQLYWSATEVAGFNRYYWGVYFEQGNNYWYNHRLDYRVRLVRTAKAN